MEDLLKKRQQDVESFLSGRVKYVNRQWWRCGRCLVRVKIDSDGWECPGCEEQCEPERRASREKAYTTAQTAENPTQGEDITGCGACQNTWLPDLNDPTNSWWIPCPICQPGSQESVQF